MSIVRNNANITALRTQAGLSQQLAKRVGTTASVICRLEDADYEGHSLAMLQSHRSRFELRLEIRFVPAMPYGRVDGSIPLPRGGAARAAPPRIHETQAR